MRLRHLLPNSLCSMMLLLLPMALLLNLAPPAQATGPVYDTWTGNFSFTATAYHKDDATGKLVKTSEPVSGTVEIYLQADGPPVVVTGPDGDFCMRFKDGSKNTIIGIAGLAGVSSGVPNAKFDSLVAVGAGVFFDIVNAESGPAYLSFTKGKLTPGGSSATTMAVSILAGGGVNGSSSYVWSGKFNVTLNKQ